MLFNRSAQFCRYLEISSDAFGLDNCTRVTIGTEKENKIFKETFLKIMEGVLS